MKICSYATFVTDGTEILMSASTGSPGSLNQRNGAPGTDFLGCWVGARTSLDVVQNWKIFFRNRTL